VLPRQEFSFCGEGKKHGMDSADRCRIIGSLPWPPLPASMIIRIFVFNIQHFFHCQNKRKLNEPTFFRWLIYFSENSQFWL